MLAEEVAPLAQLPVWLVQPGGPTGGWAGQGGCSGGLSVGEARLPGEPKGSGSLTWHYSGFVSGFGSGWVKSCPVVRYVGDGSGRAWAVCPMLLVFLVLPVCLVLLSSCEGTL